MNLAALVLIIIKVSIVLTVFAVGLKTNFSDITFLFRHPRQLVRAFLSIYVIMPVIALVLCVAFNLHPAVKIAVGALSLSPIPPLFPSKADKVVERDDFGIGLLAGIALLAIVVIPVGMNIFERITEIHLSMSPIAIGIVAFRTVLLPLLIGAGVRRIAPTVAEKYARPIGIFATVLLVAGVLPVVFVESKAMWSLVGNGTLVALTLFAVCGLAIGYFSGTADNRWVLSIATAMRHPGIAVGIAHTNFPNQRLAVPAIALYVLIAGILTAIVSARRKKTIGAVNGIRKAA